MNTLDIIDIQLKRVIELSLLIDDPEDKEDVKKLINQRIDILQKLGKQ